MGRRGASTTVSYTVKAIGLAMGVLFLAIIGAIWFGPDKPEQPPVSEISFEPPPPPDAHDFQFEPIDAPRRARSAPDDTPAPIPNEIVATGHPLAGGVTDSMTGEPLGGVTVRIYWSRTEEEQTTFENERLAMLENTDEDISVDARLGEINARLGNHVSTTTRDDGTYDIDVPQGRTLSAWFGKKRYLPKVQDDLFFAADDEPGRLDIALSNGAAISGRVTAANAPVEGIDIRIRRTTVGEITQTLEPEDSSDGFISHLEGEQTDQGGRYHISGLSPGTYEVDVRYRNTRYKPGRTLPFQRIAITHEEEHRTNVDFALTRGGLVWGYTADPQDRTPIQTNLLLVGPENMVTQGINALITAAMEGEEEIDFYGGVSDVDNKGYYEIAGIPFNREWRVYALSDDRAPQLSDPFILTESNPDVRIDMNMFDGTSVKGVVVTPNGKGIDAAEVICIPQFSDILSPFDSAKTFREDQSQSDGSFELPDLPAGNYQIYAFKKGYKYTMRGTPIYPDGYNDINNVRITLTPADHGEHVIFGRVTDSRGRPIQGAKVNLAGGSLTQLEFSDQSTETDANGDYRFDGMSLGKYFMGVEKEGYPLKNVIRVYLDKPTNITLVDSIVVTGRVLVRETNQPPGQRYTVSATPSLEISTNLWESLQSTVENASYGDTKSFDNPDGSFELHLTAGEYNLTASSDDHVPAKASLSLEAGSTATNITLYISTTGAVVEGYVRTSDNGNPQGANVVLSPAADGVLSLEDMESFGNARSYRVGADGYFRFEKIPAGEYTAHARHSGYANGQSDVISLDDSTRITGVEIRLTQGGSLEGYVTQDGQPVPNAMVMIMSANSPASTSTDANGFYYFDGMSPGTHQVAFMTGSMPDINIFDPESILDPENANIPGTETVRIEEGKVTRFDVQL